MAVSKRLRFEILRRDNHACRYCGRSAPEVKLHVDHVVPVTLGGRDDPANLVTACSDCNTGKSSVPADSPTVADVEQDSVRWSRAMAIVAQGRATERADADERYEHFLTLWNTWTYSNDQTVPLPNNWKRSIDQFLDAGLEMGDLEDLIEVAMTAKTRDEWRYFCGCCWRRISQAQENARAIIAQWEVEGG